MFAKKRNLLRHLSNHEKGTVQYYKQLNVLLGILSIMSCIVFDSTASYFIYYVIFKHSPQLI